jgi:hypothetical protein
MEITYSNYGAIVINKPFRGSMLMLDILQWSLSTIQRHQPALSLSDLGIQTISMLMLDILQWSLSTIQRHQLKHCSTDESCQSIVYSDASDISFGGYIVETPINMWFDVERGNSSIWK